VTLLADIIHGATSDAQTPSLLRKLKVVASRTRTSKLGEWVDYELNGYPSGTSVPLYRGPFAYYTNEPASLLSDFPGSGAGVFLRQPIAIIEAFRNDPGSENDLDGRTKYFYDRGIALDYNARLQFGERLFNRQVYSEIVEVVRTRVLELALRLEEVAPDAGNPDPRSGTIAQAAQVVNNYNFGDASQVAIGSSNFQQTMHVSAGDEGALMRALANAGLSEAGQMELQNALRGDLIESGGRHPTKPGRRVKAWLERTLPLVGIGASGELIAEAVTSFFGG